MRHRERVREREKREKLKRQGKLDEYLEKLEAENPKPVATEPVADLVESTMKQYKELKTLFAETTLQSVSKFDVDEKKVEKIVEALKRKKISKAKIARVEDTFGYESEDLGGFKPKMAGNTKMPAFFFSNLVKQNQSAFQKADARNRMQFRKVAPNIELEISDQSLSI